MSFEDRLRNGLRDEAGVAAPTSHAWQAVQRGARARRRNRALGSSLLAVTAIVAVVGAVLTLPADDDERRIETPPAGEEGMPGQIVAVTADERVVVLDAATGDEIRTLARGASGSIAVSDQHVYYTQPAPQECGGSRIVRVPLTGDLRFQASVPGAASPALSPDGSTLAFLRSFAEAGCNQAGSIALLPTSDITGGVIGPAIDVSTAGAGVIAPTWSSDSRVLGFVVSGPTGVDFRTLNTDALPGSVNDARPVPGVSVVPIGKRVAYLPDGQLAAVVEADDDGPSVVRVDPATGAHSDPMFRIGRDPNVSPRYLDVDPSGSSFLVAIDVGDEQLLYRWSEGDIQPARIADGIVAAAWVPGSTAPPRPEGQIAVAFEDGRVALMSESGEIDAVLVSDTDTNPAPGLTGADAITVDDEFVYFSQPRGRIDPETASEVPGGCPDNWPNSSVLQRVPRSGGTAELIAEGTHPAVSPDRTKLAYLAPAPGACTPTALIVRDLATGEEQRLDTTPLERLAFPAWNPDSTRLAVVAPDRYTPLNALIVDVDGRSLDTAQVVTVDDTSNSEPVAFFADGSKLLVPVIVGGSPDGGRNDIVVVDIATGEVERTLFGFEYEAEWRIADLEVVDDAVFVAAVGSSSPDAEPGVYRWTEEDGLEQLTGEHAWAVAPDLRAR